MYAFEIVFESVFSRNGFFGELQPRGVGDEIVTGAVAGSVRSGRQARRQQYNPQHYEATDASLYKKTIYLYFRGVNIILGRV